MEGAGGQIPMASEDSPHIVDPPSPEPETPFFIVQILSLMLTMLTSYGWHCLILGFICYFIWTRHLATHYSVWRRKREAYQEAAFAHKNPDLILQRESAVEQARRRLQERYEAESRAHAERNKAREEERKREKLAQQDALLRIGGRTLNEDSKPSCPTTSKPKPRLRAEYNPLLGGGGGSCGYRPPRRGGAAGGG